MCTGRLLYNCFCKGILIKGIIATIYYRLYKMYYTLYYTVSHCQWLYSVHIRTAYPGKLQINCFQHIVL